MDPYTSISVLSSAEFGFATLLLQLLSAFFCALYLQALTSFFIAQLASPAVFLLLSHLL